MKAKYIILFSYAILFVVAGKCQNQITTLQPPSTLNINQPACAGSVIDIPFISTGTYSPFNQYYAQLIDSTGHTAKIDTLTYIYDSRAFSNAAIPGDIVTILPLSTPTGCHYYLNIVSSTPNTISAIWGPFCIQHCDIVTNNERSLPVACLEPCQKQPHGVYDTISYTIHKYDSHAHYYKGNKFEAQLIQYSLNPPTFIPINTYLLGLNPDTLNGMIHLHIPCPDTLFAHGINPGLYYLRVIADSSSYPDSAFGTLVYITIGEPADSLYLTLGSPGPFCASINDTMYAYTNPNHQSTPYTSYYTWWITDKTHGENIIQQGNYGTLTFFDASLVGDTLVVSCQENNNNCLGNIATSDTIIILSNPNDAHTGPTHVCLGDTGIFSVPFTNNTGYRWKVNAPAHFDTAKNILKIRFDSIGTFRISITIANMCFADSTHWLVVSDTCHITSVPGINLQPQVNIFPNPSSGSFILSINAPDAETISESAPLNVEITNELGQVIYTYKNDNFQDNFSKEINLHNQANGLYFIQIIVGNQIINKKVVLEK